MLMSIFFEIYKRIDYNNRAVKNKVVNVYIKATEQ